MGGPKKGYAASTTSSSNMSTVDSSDLQSWCEVPSIAHFCSLFRQAFDLLEFDIQELEESLLLMNSEDDQSQLVQRLVIKLLKGCSNTYSKNIDSDNFNTYLRRLFLSKREDAEEDNLQFQFDCKDLLDNDIDFQDLSLRNRVRILHQLCEFRLDAEDVFEKLKNLEANSLRVEPLGKNAEGTTYWYFYGTRLYKEEFPKGDEKKRRKEKEKDKKKKKKDKKKKKKKKSSKGDAHSASSGDEDEAETNQSTWSVACLTLKDWEDLTEKYKSSKKKAEKELYETLSEGFLPEIVKMFAEKEREERRRLLLMQPKRMSSRIERKKQELEEKERVEAELREEARRLEEEYDEKLRIEREKRDEEEREKAREERLKAREAIKEERSKRFYDREFKNTKNRSALYDSDPDEQPLKPRTRERDRDYLPKTRDSDEDEEESKDSNYSDDDDGRPSKSFARTNFTNALLKAGTKSTKDSSLDKPVRKTPGLLLEAAGRSLLNKAGGGSTLNYKSGGSSILSGGATSGGLSFGLVSSKISFGLYGGHLPVDHGSYTKPKDEDNSDSRSDSSTSRNKDSEEPSNNSDIKTSESLPRQKVFSNWGGEFFKKNLDYRANTNKILEKMNLNNKASNGDSAGSATSSSSSGGFKSLARESAKRPMDSGDSSPAKKFKTSSFLNSYS